MVAKTLGIVIMVAESLGIVIEVAETFGECKLGDQIVINDS